MKVTDKNGPAVDLKTVVDKDELMAITQAGMIVRCPVKDIRATGRSAQGVRLIRLQEKDRVSSIAHVIAEEEEVIKEKSKETQPSKETTGLKEETPKPKEEPLKIEKGEEKPQPIRLPKAPKRTKSKKARPKKIRRKR